MLTNYSNCLITLEEFHLHHTQSSANLSSEVDEVDNNRHVHWKEHLQPCVSKGQAGVSCPPCRMALARFANQSPIPQTLFVGACAASQEGFS